MSEKVGRIRDVAKETGLSTSHYFTGNERR